MATEEDYLEAMIETVEADIKGTGYAYAPDEDGVMRDMLCVVKCKDELLADDAKLRFETLRALLGIEAQLASLDGTLQQLVDRVGDIPSFISRGGNHE